MGNENTITEVAARLKILEDRYTNLSRREQLAEQNLLSFERELNADLRALQERLTETRRHVHEVHERVDIIQGQIAQAASREELRVLDAYLNMIQPMVFATRTDVKKLIEDARFDIIQKTTKE